MVDLLLTLSIDLLFDLEEDSVTLRLVFAFFSDFASHDESLSELVAEGGEVLDDLDFFVE